MPSFRYTGDPGRSYPSLGVTPDLGQVVDLDADPGDGRWEPAGDSPQPPAVEPEPTSEPAEAGKEQ